MKEIDANCEGITEAYLDPTGRFIRLFFAEPDPVRITMPTEGLDQLARALVEASLQLKLRQFAALNDADRLSPAPDFEVAQVFIASRLATAEFDSHGLGVALNFQSAEKPRTGLRLILGGADPQGMIAALQGFVDQLQAEIARRPQAGPQMQ